VVRCLFTKQAPTPSQVVAVAEGGDYDEGQADLEHCRGEAQEIRGRCHRSSESLDVSARRLREANLIRGEAAGARRRELFEQLPDQQVDDARSDRTHVADTDVRDEDWEERAGMHDEQALASVDPEEVRVPVIVAWRRVDERDGALAEQVEKLSRAAYDHRSRAEPVDRRLSNLRSEPVFVEEPAQQLTTADPIELGQIGDRLLLVRRRRGASGAAC